MRRVDALLVMRTQKPNGIATTHEGVLHSVKQHLSFLDEEVAFDYLIGDYFLVIRQPLRENYGIGGEIIKVTEVTKESP
jgi:hypothetical protein